MKIPWYGKKKIKKKSMGLPGPPLGKGKVEETRGDWLADGGASVGGRSGDSEKTEVPNWDASSLPRLREGGRESSPPA